MNRFRYFIGVAFLVLLSAEALAGNLNVTWEWPTEYADGTPIAPGDLTTARIQVGTCTTTVPAVFGTMTREKVVTFPTNTTTFVTLPNGMYCARGYARTVDEESDPSNVVSVKVTNKPKPIRI